MAKKSGSPEQKEKDNNSTVRDSYYNGHKYKNNQKDNYNFVPEQEQDSEFKLEQENNLDNRDFWRREEHNKEIERSREQARDEEISDTADLVYDKEPRKKIEKEQEEQKIAATAKKLAEQKNNSNRPEVSKEDLKKEEVLDTLDLMSGMLVSACCCLKEDKEDSEDSKRARKAESDIKLFQDAISDGRINLDDEQISRFAAYRKHAKGVSINSKKSAMEYVAYAYREVLPFMAAVAIGFGVALGAVPPVKGIGTLVNLDNNLNGGLMR